MSRLDQARESVRRHPMSPVAGGSYYDGMILRDAGEITADTLAQSLHYVVDLSPTPMDDESVAPLGASKYAGLPHLPPGFAWPERHLFVAQLNLAEFHPFDAYDALPDHGMLYVFLATQTMHAAVIHHDGPVDELRVTPYPAESADFYLARFRDRPARLRFEPGGVFYVGGHAYDQSAARDLLPGELIERVGEALGAPVVWRSSGLNMFGRPLYWQCEDEIGEFTGPDGRTVVPSWGGAAAHGDRPIMLFQFEFGDASVHVWISPDDARKRNYAGCWSDVSMT